LELSWLTKLRIAAAAAIGVVLIGILAWPMVVPTDPFGAVCAGEISIVGKLVLVVLALLCGFLGFFVSKPYGREIGILAVPAGLAALAVRSGNMTSLLLQTQTSTERLSVYAALKWEPVFWLIVTAAGFLGVLLAGQIYKKPDANPTQQKPDSKSKVYFNALIALVGSLFIAKFCVMIFAQDIRWADNSLNSVLVQPTVAQIAFAVLISFGIAAFVVKKFLDASYIWPSIASALLTALAITFYAKNGVFEHLVENWPVAYFSNAVLSILPIQMVAFGTIGSVAGYWLAVRYKYWRKHEF